MKITAPLACLLIASPILPLLNQSNNDLQQSYVVLILWASLAALVTVVHLIKTLVHRKRGTDLAKATCPYCAEEVIKTARICRSCRSTLKASPLNQLAAAAAIITILLAGQNVGALLEQISSNLDDIKTGIDGLESAMSLTARN